MRPDNRKTIIAWALYDWANSAFATTIMAGLFPIFFKEYCNHGVESVVSTFRWGMANSIAGITVAVLAPILGAIADQGRAKKSFLMFFMALGVITTTALAFVSQGNWRIACLIYIAAAIGFSAGNIFYDALITLVASDKKMVIVSALGYAFGYLGGALLFTLNVLMVLHPDWFGIADETQALKISFLTVSLWWLIFSIPIFVFVKEPRRETPGGTAVIRAGLKQLAATFKKIRSSRTIFIFLLAYWFYIDGVDTIVRMAVDYGKSLEITTETLITALLVVNFVGFPAAIAFGYLGKRIGARRGIFIAILVYLAVSIWGAFIRTTFDFYLLAVIIGLVQGGIQSLSRSFFARIIPTDQAAEYFGFYNMLGKFAVFIGPILVGGFGLLARKMGASADLASRIGISSIALLFLIGGFFLTQVNEQQAQAEREKLTEKT